MFFLRLFMLFVGFACWQNVLLAQKKQDDFSFIESEISNPVWQTFLEKNEDILENSQAICLNTNCSNYLNAGKLSIEMYPATELHFRALPSYCFKFSSKRKKAVIEMNYKGLYRRDNSATSASVQVSAKYQKKKNKWVCTSRNYIDLNFAHLGSNKESIKNKYISLQKIASELAPAK